MAFDVLVPQMGESVLEGTILEWKVKVGDKIALNQPLVELMTDKVNIEIPAETAGILTEQLVKVGEVVPVGTRIAVIDNGSGVKAKSPEAKAHESAPAKSDSAPAVSASTAPAKSVKGTADRGKGKMSPKVKMMVRQYSIDPSAITPTGKNGLVTVEDVERTVAERSRAQGFTAGPIPSPALSVTPMFAPAATTVAPSAASKEPAKPLVEVPIPKFEPLPAAQRETRKPLQGVRKLIADHMVKSIRTATHVTTFEEIDMTELVNYRETIKDNFKRTYGANITYMPFIVKACCLALKEFPTINASMTDAEIIYKHYYNIGIAVARDEGLIVPVIKDADKKTIVELAVEIQQIGNRTKSNQLKPDDVAGGTFSVTNAGMFGATASTPIINQPQVAILGIHNITKRPWVVNDEIVIRHISSFGMSFDHRLIDGHTAVQFLHRVHTYLADLNLLLLQLR